MQPPVDTHKKEIEPLSHVVFPVGEFVFGPLPQTVDHVPELVYAFPRAFPTAEVKVVDVRNPLTDKTYKVHKVYIAVNYETVPLAKKANETVPSGGVENCVAESWHHPAQDFDFPDCDTLRAGYVIGFLFDCGVIHLDLNPGNVIVECKGSVGSNDPKRGQRVWFVDYSDVVLPRGGVIERMYTHKGIIERHRFPISDVITQWSFHTMESSFPERFFSTWLRTFNISELLEHGQIVKRHGLLSRYGDNVLQWLAESARDGADASRVGGGIPTIRIATPPSIKAYVDAASKILAQWTAPTEKTPNDVVALLVACDALARSLNNNVNVEKLIEFSKYVVGGATTAYLKETDKVKPWTFEVLAKCSSQLFWIAVRESLHHFLTDEELDFLAHSAGSAFIGRDFEAKLLAACMVRIMLRAARRGMLPSAAYTSPHIEFVQDTTEPSESIAEIPQFQAYPFGASLVDLQRELEFARFLGGNFSRVSAASPNERSGGNWVRIAPKQYVRYC